MNTAILPLVLPAALFVFFSVCLWKVFEKSGEHGWAALIPFYNVSVLAKIARTLTNGSWLLIFVPVINAFIVVKLLFNLAKMFDKGTGFAIGLIFLPFVFFPILAFGEATFIRERFDSAERNSYQSFSCTDKAYLPSPSFYHHENNDSRVQNKNDRLRRLFTRDKLIQYIASIFLIAASFFMLIFTADILSSFADRPKDFTFESITITLTSRFKTEEESPELKSILRNAGLQHGLISSDVICLVNAKKGVYNTALDDFIESFKSSDIYKSEEIEEKKEGDTVYYETNIAIETKSYLFFYSFENEIWCVEFIVKAGKTDQYHDLLIKWANSVGFE